MDAFVDDFNQYFSDFPVPFWQFAADKLHVLFDKTGAIIKFWGGDHSALANLIPEFKKHNNISDVFIVDESGFGYGNENSLHSKRDANLSISNDEFFTNLPVLTLAVFPAKDGNYFGIIRRVNIFPDVQTPKVTLSVIFDEKERIRGFNRNFALLFKETLKDPNDLLDRPARDFFDPTPQAFQRLNLQRLSNHAADFKENLFDWKVFYDQRAIFYHPEHVRLLGKELVWENPGEEDDFISLLPGLNTLENDFEFRVEASELSQAPYLIAGDPKTQPDDPYPDHNGYFSGGFDGYPIMRGYHLKKQGFMLFHQPMEIGKGPAVCALTKRGRGLWYSINGKTVIEYYDPDFIENPDVKFVLALRPGARAHLKDVRISYAKSPLDQSANESFTRIKSKTGEERHFSMSRYQNRAMTSNFFECQGYVFHDVTTLHTQAENYKQQYLKEKNKSALLEFGPAGDGWVIGGSHAMHRIRAQAEAAAMANVPVLLQGGTGTGKGVLAHYMHAVDRGKEKPFVTVDCSAIPQELIESELFGYEPGAFTGAVGRKIGRFEEANTGTLFLDEVGNLDGRMQAKLLGVLQDFTITRLGGVAPVPLDIRLISASNADLAALIKQGRFREDLFFRINTVTLTLPPLKERMQDIPDLCNQFIAQFNRSLHKSIQGLSPESYRKLYAHAWPGNIRELKNVIHKAAIFCEGKWIRPEHLQLEADEFLTRRFGRPTYHLEDLDRETLVALAEKHKGKISAMAQALKVTRPACYANLKKWGVDINLFRRGRR